MEFDFAIRHLRSKYLQLHNSPVDSDQELRKPSKDSARLLVCNKKMYALGFRFFWVTAQMG